MWTLSDWVNALSAFPFETLETAPWICSVDHKTYRRFMVQTKISLNLQIFHNVKLHSNEFYAHFRVS